MEALEAGARPQVVAVDKVVAEEEEEQRRDARQRDVHEHAH